MDLTKANDGLVAELLKTRKTMQTQKRRFQSQKTQLESGLRVTQEELDQISVSRATEVQALSTSLKEAQRQALQQRESMLQETRTLKASHEKESEKKDKELEDTQDSHKKYLAKLMNVLETTHKLREKESTRLNDELKAVKKEKDSQIEVLRSEVKALRTKNIRSAGLKDLRTAIDAKSLRRQLTDENKARSNRMAHFEDTLQSLFGLVAESCVLSSEFEDRDIAQVILQQERGASMRAALEQLEDLYRLEEDSQTKISQNSLSLVQDYVAVAEPNRHVRDLQERLDLMHKETHRLQEELRRKKECRRCEIRDKAARAKIHKDSPWNRYAYSSSSR